MFARALICVRGCLSRQPQELGGWGWELRAGGYRAGRGGGVGWCVHQTRRFISPNAAMPSASCKRLLRRLPLRLQDREPGPHCLSCPAPPSPPLPTSASSGAARGPSEAERLAPGLLAFRSGACGVGGECRGREERGGRNTRARCPDVPGGLVGGVYLTHLLVSLSLSSV